MKDTALRHILFCIRKDRGQLPGTCQDPEIVPTVSAQISVERHAARTTARCLDRKFPVFRLEAIFIIAAYALNKMKFNFTAITMLCNTIGKA